MSDLGNEIDVGPQQTKRLVTIRQLLKTPGYEWLSESTMRHWIFNAQARQGSGGYGIPGNGFASVTIRFGRKILIDLDRFDAWIEAHRGVE